MDFTIKNRLSFFGIISYIVLNIIGIYIQMSNGVYSILLFSHIIIFIVYIFNYDNIFKILKNKYLLIFLFFLLISILYNHMYYLFRDDTLDFISQYKLFFVNILHNFFLGGLFIFFLQQLEKKQIKKLFYVLSTLGLILLIYFLIEMLFFGRFEENLFRIIFQGDNNLYQTFSDYTNRLIFIIIVVSYFLNNNKSNKHNLLISITIIILIFLQSIVGSNKGPLILLVLLFFYILKSPTKFKFLILVLILMVGYYNIDISEFNPRFITQGFDSVSARLSFFDRIGDLFMVNPVLGSHFAHDILNTDYVHSSVLSAFIGVGLFGGIFYSLSKDFFYITIYIL